MKQIPEHLCFTEKEIKAIRSICDAQLEFLPKAVEFVDTLLGALKRESMIDAGIYLQLNILLEKLKSKQATDLINGLERIAYKMEGINNLKNEKN